MRNPRRHTIRLAVVVLALWPLRLTAQTTVGSPLDVAAHASAIDSVFAQFDNTRSPGCVVGVHQAGELVFARGYGMADLERGVPLGPRSVFRIGSTSKQITAASIVLLEQDGLLSLDDPIHRHLPELQDFGQTVTIRQMLNMTSGLRDYLVLTDVAGFREDDYYTDADLFELLSRQRELNFEAGSEWLYSNSGYFLASQIVLRVSGKSLRDFAKERIFSPLGMERTHYHDDHTEIVPERAMGYTRAADGYALSMTTLPMTGDGGVFTTVEEWARWNRNFDEPRVGGEALLRTLLTRAVLNNGDTLDYTMGLRHGTHRGLSTVRHGGAFVGFRADHVRYPSQDLAVTCFCNLAQTNPSALAARVAEVLLVDHMDPGAPPSRDASAQSTAEASARRAVTGAQAQRWVGGFYSDELDMTYTFSLGEDGALVARFGSQTRPVTLRGEGAFAIGNLELRPQAGSGRIEQFFLDAGRVQNLRFERMDP